MARGFSIDDDHFENKVDVDNGDEDDNGDEEDEDDNDDNDDEDDPCGITG